MRNLLTLTKRELSAYFTSPIGYIFMMVFVTISVGLFITPFFSFPSADMRGYFSSLPLMLCVFIPAITMRTWAQERSENTWEMLLTFPMSAWQLTLGKFLASFIFFTLTLCATATMPVMLKALGNPDSAVIVSSYFGTLLLGGYFLALGIFFSGFFKDQILAFIVTLLVCFTLFMLGTGFCVTYIDGFIPGLGVTLSEILGIVNHFTPFTRGVIELADIVFFIVWTVIFLLLNILYIDGRSRPKARAIFAMVLSVFLAIGLMGNWLMADISMGRYDITEGKIFTVSQGAKNILGQLDTPVQVKLYISPKKDMPTGWTAMEQDISDALEELQVASDGQLQFSVINLQVSEVIAMQDTPADEDNPADESEVDAIETRLLDKGIEPFTARAMTGNDQLTNKLIYCSIGIAYKDKNEEIIPKISPQDLDSLEYALVSRIYKLAQTTQPVVALVASTDRVTVAPELRRMYEKLGQAVPDTEDPYDGLEQLLDYEGYAVERVELTQESPLPEAYDTLVVLNPRQLTDRQCWEINRAVVSGKSVILAVQHYKWDYTQSRGQLRPNIDPQRPGINELLRAYGLSVDDDLLMDVNTLPLNMQVSADPRVPPRSINLPTHMLVNNNSMAQEISITSRLAPIYYLWGTALQLDADQLAENKLEVHTLISTSDQAWKAAMGEKLTTTIFENPETMEGPYPLMALLKGQFPDAFAGKDRPLWPAEFSTDAVSAPEDVVPAPGQLIVLGCAQLFRREFLSSGNLDLFINSVDAVTLGDDLVHVRSRKPLDRLINLPNVRSRNFWKLINYGLANGIIAFTGILSAVVRRRSRNAYTVAHLDTSSE